jgi:Holliday junction resolvasome RuvABC endonuclease subunit
MIFLGIDPDTKHTGLAVVKATPLSRMHTEFEVLKVGVAEAKGRLVQDRLVEMAMEIDLFVDGIFRMFDVNSCVVEWQKLRPNKEKNPNAILDLTGVAGMAVAACWQEGGKVHTPIPSEWKGTVDKQIHQKRILKAITLNTECGFKQLKRTHLSHVVDAIGLAMWGFEKFKLTRRSTK